MIETCKNLVSYKINKLPPFAKLIISNNIRCTNIWNFADYLPQEVMDIHVCMNCFQNTLIQTNQLNK